MAVQITSAMTDIKLVAGNGRPTVQNFNASGPGTLLVPLFGRVHVLYG